jgi:hypothetical protein
MASIACSFSAGFGSANHDTRARRFLVQRFNAVTSATQNRTHAAKARTFRRTLRKKLIVCQPLQQVRHLFGVAQ